MAPTRSSQAQRWGHEGAAAGQALVHPAELAAQRGQGFGQTGLERRQIEVRPEVEPAAVGGEVGWQAVGLGAEDHGDGCLEELAVGPAADAPGHAGAAAGEEAWLRMAPLQFAQDALAVAEDVGADLHHRG